MPRFSIVVPVYNVAPYLRACLNSLCIAVEKFLQLGDGTVEIVCVDDGSTDGGGAILDKYAADRQYFRVIHQDNKGLGPTRNVGMDDAKGEWLLFVDSDDEVVPDYLLVLNNIIKQHSPDAIRFGHKNVSVLGEVSQDITDIEVRAPDADKNPQAVFNAMNSAFAWNTCYRRKLTEGVRYADITPGEDVLFSCQMLPMVNRVAITKAPLYHYLQRDGSLMHKKAISFKQIESSGICMIGRIEHLRTWKYFNSIRKALFKIVRTTYIGQVGLMLDRLCSDDFVAAWNKYWECGREIFSMGADFMPCFRRRLALKIFRLESKLLWRILLFNPWRMRVAMLRFNSIARLRKHTRSK